MVSGGGSSETVERKLRQIYDAFDNRNYKVGAIAIAGPADGGCAISAAAPNLSTKPPT
jgi:hypothetical protein